VSPLDEIAPGLWRFTVTRNGLPPTMTAYALRDGEKRPLVGDIFFDGFDFGENGVAMIEKVGQRRVNLA